MNDFAAKVIKGLQANSATPGDISLVADSVKPDVSKGPNSSTSRIVEFQVNYPKSPKCGDRIRKIYNVGDDSPSSIAATSE
eukprot:6861104-Prymnesium_polylepis.1